MHVGQVQVEQDDVVFVEFAEIDALFAEIGGVDVVPLGHEHHLDCLGDSRLVFDQQNPHRLNPFWPLHAPDKGPLTGR